MPDSESTQEAGKTVAQRDALLSAALQHVPFDGMGNQALAAGAGDLGMSPDLAHVLIPGGGAGLAAAYHRRADAQLARWLAENPPEGRIRDRIAASVLKRLDLVDRDLVRAGAVCLSLPAHAPMALRLLGETADVIWSGLNDPSQDVNWWTKRGMLASVIAATVLYWLGDDSADAQDTRHFLDRRIERIMGIEKTRARLRKLPGMKALEHAATGWIKAPENPDLPGGQNVFSK